MSKKYILTEESMRIDDSILYRIKAVKSFGDVKEGDLGGWVESEDNLSHEGNCWIYSKASVYSNAKVYGDAKVSDRAVVHGSAWVDGNAKVSGNAIVSDGAIVYGAAKVGGDSKVEGSTRIYERPNKIGDEHMQATKTFKQIDKVWESYCKMVDTDVSDSISISYNPTELDQYKVEISDAKHSIHLSKQEAWLLARKLVELTWDEDVLQEEMK